MMRIIQNKGDALDKAEVYVESCHVEMPIDDLRRYLRTWGFSYPCLMEFYIHYVREHSREGSGTLRPQLRFHHCSRSLAKCLIYKRTNPMPMEGATPGYGHWKLIHTASLLGGMIAFKKYEEIFTKGILARPRVVELSEESYEKSLVKALNEKESFLLSAVASVDSLDKNVIRKAIVDVDTANNLVHLDKHIEMLQNLPMGAIDVALNKIEPGWRSRPNVACINYASRMRKWIKKKIEEDQILPF